MTNIAELLKDAPKGMKLYSPLLGEVEFAEVMGTDYVPIRVMCGTIGERFDEFGRYKGNEYPNAECLLFPSKDCRTWEGWKVPIKPMFKVGDEIKTGNTIETIAEVGHATRSYYCESGRTIYFKNQDLWHLVPKPHYDIANFKPFDKVLVRDSDIDFWDVDLFARYLDEFQCFRGSWEQCIPFEGNEHLHWTTNMCDEQYINWQNYD